MANLSVDPIRSDTQYKLGHLVLGQMRIAGYIVRAITLVTGNYTEWRVPKYWLEVVSFGFTDSDMREN